MKITRHFWLYLPQFFLEWEVFQTKVVEEIKTQILCSITFFFFKSYRLWDNVEIYCRAGQGADDDMAHAHFILYNQEYRHTHKCISYCFSTAKMFTWTRLNVTLYVLCLSRPSSLSSQDELLILPLSVVRTSSATLVPAAADKHPSCKVHYTL